MLFRGKTMKSHGRSSVTYLDTDKRECPKDARKRVKRMAAGFILLCWLWVAFSAVSVAAQGQAPQRDRAVPPSAVITKSVRAVGYEVGGGSTKVDLKGTDLMPWGSGQAKVEIKSSAGRTS